MTPGQRFLSLFRSAHIDTWQLSQMSQQGRLAGPGMFGRSEEEVVELIWEARDAEKAAKEAGRSAPSRGGELPRTGG